MAEQAPHFSSQDFFGQPLFEAFQTLATAK
jgi:hypothetical protein